MLSHFVQCNLEHSIVSFGDGPGHFAGDFSDCPFQVTEPGLTGVLAYNPLHRVTVEMDLFCGQAVFLNLLGNQVPFGYFYLLFFCIT